MKNKVVKNMRIIEEIRDEIQQDYENGKISEEHYKKLMNNIN